MHPHSKINIYLRFVLALQQYKMEFYLKLFPPNDYYLNIIISELIGNVPR